MLKAGRTRLLMLVCTLVLATSSAQAELISFKVTGTVMSVQGFNSLVQVGDTVTYCYTFESTTADASPDNSNFGRYLDAVVAATVEAGSLSLSESASTNGRITVRNPNPIRMRDSDFYSATAGSLEGTGFTGAWATVSLSDRSKTALSSDALPLAPLDVSAFGTRRTLSIRAPGSRKKTNSIIATVDSMEFCGDTTPPTVVCSVATISLWPPNHKLADVGLDYVVTDDQDPNPTVEVLVFSDEAEEGDGDGNTELDAIDDGESLWLRAERSGNGDGRVYLIVVVATDASGNVGFDCCTVTVPHNKSKASRNDADDQAIAAEADCLIDGAAPVGFFSLIE